MLAMGCTDVRRLAVRQHVPESVHHPELIPLAILERRQPDVDVAEVPGLRRVARDLNELQKPPVHAHGWLRHAVGDDLGRLEARAPGARRLISNPTGRRY